MSHCQSLDAAAKSAGFRSWNEALVSFRDAPVKDKVPSHEVQAAGDQAETPGGWPQKLPTLKNGYYSIADAGGDEYELDGSGRRLRLDHIRGPKADQVDLALLGKAEKLGKVLGKVREEIYYNSSGGARELHTVLFGEVYSYRGLIVATTLHRPVLSGYDDTEYVAAWDAKDNWMEGLAAWLPVHGTAAALELLLEDIQNRRGGN